jgi:lambda family phage minor tail protein L
MTLDLTATVVTEKAKTEGTAPLRLFAIEYGDSSASILYFAQHNVDVEYFKPNTATQQTYTAFPAQVGNIEYATVDQSPKVTVTVSNVDRAMSSYMLTYDGLRGRTISIIRVFKSLISDPNACIVDKYCVDSAQLTGQAVSFELAPKTTVDGISVPLRRFSRYQCQWTFKSQECTGTPGTPSNSSLASPGYTTCRKSLGSCASYNNITRYGGHPGIPKRRVYFG